MRSGPYGEYKKKPVKERFWEKVDKRGPKQPHMKTRCWMWKGAKDRNGYGCFSWSEERLAHRASWVLRHGPVPTGLLVLHECDFPSCVRHLYVGSHKVNSQDMVRRGRLSASRFASKNRGEQNGMAKLTDAEVVWLRRKYRPRSGADRGNLSELASSMGVTTSAVSRALRLRN